MGIKICQKFTVSKHPWPINWGHSAKGETGGELLKIWKKKKLRVPSCHSIVRSGCFVISSVMYQLMLSTGLRPQASHCEMQSRMLEIAPNFEQETG